MADEIIAPDYVDKVAGDGSPVGPDGFKQAVAGIKSAFPDFTITIDDMISEDDKVALVWTFKGTHKGELMGIAPTDKRVESDGVRSLLLLCAHRVETIGPVNGFVGPHLVVVFGVEPARRARRV